MKYVLLTEGTSRVAEIIPSENPAFPGIPIEQRYAPGFVQKLIPVDDAVEVSQHWEYDELSKTFHPMQTQNTDITD